MTRYLLDSNAVTAFTSHNAAVHTRMREARLRGDVLGTCEPVVAELLLGLEFSASRETNRIRLNRALVNLRSWPFDRAAAQAFAPIAADLKRRGLQIQMVDMMIAAIAIAMRNTTVVTSDSDLLRISGLTVENWAAPVEGSTP